MLENLFRMLRSEDHVQIQRGLDALADQLATLGEAELEQAVQAITVLFYVDPIDHPELLPLLHRAEDLLAELRQKAIPVVLRLLGESDLKIHFHLAAALGKMGYAAVEPLLSAYKNTQDPYERVFILYAMGKVKDPKVLEALPVVFEALDDPNPELRDTSARALGKICEHVNPELIRGETRAEMFDRLMACVSDRLAGVRSKAVRSLGKMARFDLLDGERQSRLRAALASVLGEDDAANWDVAYIVRAEAERARAYL